MSDPAPVTVLNAEGASPFVLLCEHASNHIPARYGRLGVPEAELSRHIAWDIGAADLARRLSALLDAPLLLAGASRLLIDLNRPPGAPTSIPERSEDTPIPGNAGIGAEERATREAAWFDPFHDAVAALLDRRQAGEVRTLVIGVHSFTPRFQGVDRPWHAGVLFAGAKTFGCALAEAIGASDPALVVGQNEPYRIEPGIHDYTVPVHGDERGLEAVLIEVRQDLLGDAAGIETWALRLASALGQAAGRG
ncbi:N-formylglutamate amidohydrolase [Muricoccus pecuniae]|uniref:Putative N-formylglutamate amidohydrolase n=1 Tax=Muricoccus pecuniae TaxID=693023 RepID=A0A840XVE1_9PROT|nr:N-formylglutamate amidohydrolase [Roseomonas pecuniae]MBB5692495.1 putative N-formylglutamate amidohydrolase [Roseomonas pecuniae]